MGTRLNRALSRIPDEFVGQPFYQAFMTSIVNRLEESDQIIADLATLRWIDTAEGVWLDTVGEIVGIPRFYEPITEGIFTYNGFGPQLVTDGDMEAAGTDAWDPFSNPILTKEAGARPGGSGSQVLRITRVDTSLPGARQSIGIVAGKTYRYRGWAKSTGTSVRPRVFQSGNAVWTGAFSNEWQQFDELSVMAGAATVYYYHNGTNGYTDYDDVSVVEVPPNDPDLGYSGLPAPGAGGIYNSVNGLFSDTLIDDDTYRRYIKAKAKATGTPGTLTDIYTFVKEAFDVESIVTTSGTRAVTVTLLEALTQGQKLQLKQWAPLSAAVSIQVVGP